MMTTPTKVTVMYVEDEPYEYPVTVRKLEQDYNLIIADSPEEALAKLKNESGQVDLILLDIRLKSPVRGKEGLELAHQLRQAGYAMPILGYSVEHDKNSHDKAKELGIEIMPKKVRYEQLKAEIERQISLKGRRLA